MEQFQTDLNFVSLFSFKSKDKCVSVQFWILKATFLEDNINIVPSEVKVVNTIMFFLKFHLFLLSF